MSFNNFPIFPIPNQVEVEVSTPNSGWWLGYVTNRSGAVPSPESPTSNPTPKRIASYAGQHARASVDGFL